MSGTSEIEGKFVRQSGGRGQYGEVYARVLPREEGGSMFWVSMGLDLDVSHGAQVEDRKSASAFGDARILVVTESDAVRASVEAIRGWQPELVILDDPTSPEL